MNDFEVCSVSVSRARGRLPTESSCGPGGSVHRLGNVHAVDVVLELTIDEGDQYGKTRLKLEQVPRFLINAFNFINSHGMNAEGIFRREGNTCRLNQNNWAVYLGAAPIPSNFTVHDVCSMVKRFFRDLKEPLLPYPVIGKRLFDLAKKSETMPIKRKEFCMIFEPGLKAAMRDFDNFLPPAHIGTLGYLMRQLHRISRHSDKHQMTAINLATVLAPTLLRDDGAKEKVIKRKERRGSQDDLLNSVREDTGPKIAAVLLMIEHANWIGLNPHCYVTSIHHHRSSSAAPSPRPFLVDVSSLKGKPSLDRTNSVNVNQPRRTKCTSQRRSSSAFRGIINGIGDRFRRRSRSRDREQGHLLKPVADRRASSPAVFPPNEPLSSRLYSRSCRGASPPRYMLEFHDYPAYFAASEHFQGRDCHDVLRPSSTHVSRSRESRCSSIVKQIRPNSEVLKDNPVSMLGEEYFNPQYREQHERTRRRHTTPVKTSTALRRNQPNSRHSGLVNPKRRNTVINANDQEKENCGYQRSVSVTVSSPCDGFDGTPLEDEDTSIADRSAELLSQKGQESRLRRVKLQQRKETSLLLQNSLLDDSSTLQKSPVKNSGRMMVSVASSPIIFPKAEDQAHGNHGSAVVGETIVVSAAALRLDSTSLRKESEKFNQCLPSSSSSAAVEDVLKFDSFGTSTEQDEDGTKKRDTTGSNEETSRVVFRVQSLRHPTDESAGSTIHSGDHVPLQVSLAEEINRYLVSRTGGSLESSSVGDDVFSSSNDMKPAILNARTNEELVDNFDRGFRVRPSVALIEKQGIVRDRVKMFKQLGNSMPVPLESMTARSSGLSSRSSLDAGDEEYVKPSAPPVTHSLNMGGPRRNSNTVSSHQPGSSLQSPK
ncbi:hypothetical protein KIN20_034668 [Parelaphostrongylus tenuis]|uniref:Rho-GAP domain-containing protein n=1 Tax=Parelaphostrongylus tenuis TaxID=148309 RepID=A0AAD5RA03_PARTN|nr:hypothetical protein KIN20_034668 [Parelaphostrongylus tenuis]